jgi:hypothetical protein
MTVASDLLRAAAVLCDGNAASMCSCVYERNLRISWRYFLCSIFGTYVRPISQNVSEFCQTTMLHTHILFASYLIWMFTYRLTTFVGDFHDDFSQLIKKMWIFFFVKSAAVTSSVLHLFSLHNCHQVKVKVTLRPTIIRLVRLGVRRPSETRDQFFYLLEIFF